MAGHEVCRMSSPLERTGLTEDHEDSSVFDESLGHSLGSRDSAGVVGGGHDDDHSLDILPGVGSLEFGVGRLQAGLEVRVSLVVEGQGQDVIQVVVVHTSQRPVHTGLVTVGDDTHSGRVVLNPLFYYRMAEGLTVPT